MSITSKQLTLLHVARSRLHLDENAYRALLHSCGGVESARDLDAAGFALVMYRVEELGFRSDTVKRTYGVRPGMASPRQVAFIRRLWTEWSDAGAAAAALNRWLERHFTVSAVRFLDERAAHNAIVALKVMNARKAETRAGGDSRAALDHS